jgi:hypothetical protein
MKMSIKVERLMNEAIRRYCLFHAGEPLRNAWIGLGTATEYKPAIDEGLMIFHDGVKPYKRCMGWLILTDKGTTLFLQMIAAHMNTHCDLNSYSNHYELIR